MGVVTYDQANLLLHLYELRREPRLREARAWFVTHFDAQSPEEMGRKYPPGTEENTNVRMVLSYWEMAAGMANRGLIDDDFFFESAGEGFLVWDRVRGMFPAMREAFQNPHVWGQLDAFGQRMEAWQEKRAPGHVAAMRKRMASQRQALAAKAATE